MPATRCVWCRPLAGNPRQPRIGVPAENYYVNLADHGRAMLMCVWPSPGQRVELLLSGDAKPSITGFEIACSEQKDRFIWLALIDGAALWHERSLGSEAKTTLDWRPPFPAKWRADLVRAQGIAQSCYFYNGEGAGDEQPAVRQPCPCRFESDRPVVDRLPDRKSTPQTTDALIVYRLPTEAEWEYACRAGSTTRWSFGDEPSELSRHAWFKQNAGKGTHPVKQKAENPWGLYDMYGNVAEWCHDCHRETYPAEAALDPHGPDSGQERVLRGGSWNTSEDSCRSGARRAETPAFATAAPAMAPAKTRLPSSHASWISPNRTEACVPQFDRGLAEREGLGDVVVLFHLLRAERFHRDLLPYQ